MLGRFVRAQTVSSDNSRLVLLPHLSIDEFLYHLCSPNRLPSHPYPIFITYIRRRIYVLQDVEGVTKMTENRTRTCSRQKRNLSSTNDEVQDSNFLEIFRILIGWASGRQTGANENANPSTQRKNHPRMLTKSNNNNQSKS